MLDPRAIAVGGVSYGALSMALLGSLPSALPPVADAASGSGRSRRAVPDVGRNVGGRGAVDGLSDVGLAAVREMVRPAAVSGAAIVSAAAVRERVDGIVVGGASAVSVVARGERVPVLSDDELMALAVWASRHRH